MRRVTRKLKWGRPGKIKKAIDHCNLHEMRKRQEANLQHLRKGQVGDYRNFLHGEHYEVFRNMHSELILSLGYNVVGNDGALIVEPAPQIR